MWHSTSINPFKAGLEHFKLSNPDPLNGFWQLSELIQLTEHGIYLLVNQDFALWQNILLSMTFYLLFYCFTIAYWIFFPIITHFPFTM